MWRVKDVVCNLNLRSCVAFISRKAFVPTQWYFNSGCSRYMSEVKGFLVASKSHSKENVTFGDGAKDCVLGKGKLSCPCLPILEDILLVDGLIDNLISVSKLCDQDFQVSFSTNKCFVYNDNGRLVMSCLRSSDDFYLLTSDKSSLTCAW